ncbi:recombinase family protein [Streptomyces sp. NBC_00385]|uniref:recombinase family protein n=1 Tax=Streptomyces sp. NBC_00385 TaxID=2975733 RepID=UPI002DD98799|nr:recombinase family protein [Streptomyces sp. NBC_00385]WRZ07146.1 recombinase family protein [Streptomyces sp. NBC_00385]
MDALRAVVYVRLSRSTESSTSLARQEASCRAYAERQGWAVLRVFQDCDVSGSEPPGERPALRELCASLSHYDVLLTWRADRIARSLLHFSSVVDACGGAGVRLVTVEDGWDMSTSHGRFAANVLASFAQFERELGRERTVSSQSHLRKSGRWAGGRVPYGLRPVLNPAGSGKILVRDERAEPVVREIAERILAGEAPTRIAADLQARGVPAPRVHNSTRADPVPSAWTHKSIKIVMTSQTLLGRRIEHRTGKVICGEKGPVEFWPPVVTEAEFARIAQNIETRYRPRRPNRPSHWLHGVVTCGVCGRNMKRSESSGSETFRCLGPLAEPHRGVSIKGDLLETWLVGELRERLRQARVVEHTYRPDMYLGDEIKRLRTYLAELLDDRRSGMFSTPEAVKVFRHEYRMASSRLEECERQPRISGGWEVRAAAQPMWEAWDRWSPEERGSYLIGCRVRAVVSAPPRPRARVQASARCVCDLGDLADFDRVVPR